MLCVLGYSCQNLKVDAAVFCVSACCQHPFSSTYPIQGHRGAGDSPSCLRASGKVHPRQVKTLSQG